MKRIVPFIAIISLCAVLSVSCYPGGGTTGGNINNPEYRIVGPWQITHTYLNGVEIDSTNYYANQPGAFYNFYADHPLEVMNYVNGQVRYSINGFWYFTDDNSKLQISKVNFMGRRYEYTAEIYKLTRRELIYDYYDDNGNHWRIHMNNRSTYAY